MIYLNWKYIGNFLLVLLVLGGSILIASWDFKVNGKKAESIMNDLESQYNLLQSNPQAIQLNHYSTYKTRQALVVSKYSTDLNFSKIRAFYDQELTKQGWIFCKEEQLSYWGQNLGGIVVYYRKGEYTASLEYAGNIPGYSWTYSLDLTWGLENCD